MSYFRFHLIFNIPLLFLLFWGAGASFFQGSILLMAGIVLAVAFIFTTPWDNYAAAKGIWGFPEKQYSLKVGYLPIEEYAFFILESLEAILLTFLFLEWLGPFESWKANGLYGGASWLDLQIAGPATLIVVGWLILGGVMWKKVKKTIRFHYAWHLFYWFLPVIFLQWVIGWEVIFPRWSVILAVTIVLGTYLSVADYIAVHQGTWFFDEKQITGWKWKGILPWEEIAFFYLTAFLVSQSFILLLPEQFR